MQIFGALVIVLLILGVIVGGCSIIATSFSNAIDSTANIAVTSIEQRNMTQREKIEWAAKVDIAEIGADTEKKTSLKFLLFWVTRVVVWSVVLIMMYSVVMDAITRKEHDEQRDEVSAGETDSDPA